MRVAVVNWSARRVGGIEEYLSILIPAMHRAGLQIAFWHEMDQPSDRSRIDLPEGILDICAADVGVDSAILALRQWKPDVLYIHGLTDSSVESRLLTIAPSVLFLHTYVGTCISGGKTFTRPTVTPCDRKFGWPCLLHYFPHGCGGRSPITMWQHFRRQSHQLKLLGHYHAIITHTEHMRDEMTKHGMRAEVVPYPVAVQAVREAASGNGTWRLLFAGRMDYLKGGSVLLDALSEVAVKRPAHLTLAGDGPDRLRWEACAREIQTRTPNVTTEFVGWVTHERIGALMNDADLLVVPSLWPEPFGSVGPAAGQHGVPAAAFATGGIPQWLVDGVNGHLAPADPPTSAGLASAIFACLEDPPHYAALRKGAREIATRFTMERHLPRLIDTLQRVAGSRQTV